MSGIWYLVFGIWYLILVLVLILMSDVWCLVFGVSIGGSGGIEVGIGTNIWC